MTPKQKQEDQKHAQDIIRTILDAQQHKHIKGVVTAVSQSGMSRRIKFFTIDTWTKYNSDGNKQDLPYVREVTHLVGRALGWSWNDRGVQVSGCGMDMVFHSVYTLSRVLYRDMQNDTLKDAGYLVDYR